MVNILTFLTHINRLVLYIIFTFYVTNYDVYNNDNSEKSKDCF